MSFNDITYYSLWVVIFGAYAFLYRNFIRKGREKKSEALILINLGAYYLAYTIINDYTFSENEKSYIFPAFIVLLMLLVGHLFNEFFDSPEQKFKASKVSLDSLTRIEDLLPTYKKVAEFKNSDISIYPRFTIYELISEDSHERQMIFDSSDFEIINKTFGAFNGEQQSFSSNELIEFNSKQYSTKKINVDFMKIFDDYNMGHTKVYTGIDTPYNIQIIIEVQEKD